MQVRVAAALGNYTRAIPASIGQIYTVDIDLGHISIAINAGHRLSLLLSASNFPKLLINPNDASAPLADRHNPRPVTISIADQSFIELFVETKAGG
jgi:predicted acyl esterase